MRFSEILGQESAVHTLQQAMGTDKVAHAYLFAGPKGVGKRSSAMALAMALNCETNTLNPCLTCGSCKKILRDSHPDIISVTCPEKKTRIPIELIREFEKRIHGQPHEGNVRVSTIVDADLMTEPAANALLKTLEEPSRRNIIILTSSRIHGLLPTVRSRCQIIRFRPLSVDVLERLLMAKNVPRETAEILAALAGGSMTLALEYTTEDLDAQLNLALDFLESSVHETPELGLRIAAGFSKMREPAVALLNMMQRVISELIWVSTHRDADENRALSKRLGPRLSALAVKIQPSRFNNFAAAVNRAMVGMQNNNMSPQFSLETVLMSIRDRKDPFSIENNFGVL